MIISPRFSASPTPSSPPIAHLPSSSLCAWGVRFSPRRQVRSGDRRPEEGDAASADQGDAQLRQVVLREFGLLQEVEAPRQHLAIGLIEGRQALMRGRAERAGASAPPPPKPHRRPQNTSRHRAAQSASRSDGADDAADSDELDEPDEPERPRGVTCLCNGTVRARDGQVGRSGRVARRSEPPRRRGGARPCVQQGWGLGVRRVAKALW